LPEPNAKRWKR